jgi:ABC-type sugar transport system ATPase subunit
MSDEYILQMKNIHKSFGGLKALHGVDLELRHREVLGLVGDNAAGKSTLMKILTGAYHADEGRIIFDGSEVAMLNPPTSKKLGIEMVYQNFELCPNLDVPANLFLGREVTSKSFLRFLRKKEMERIAVRELQKLRIEIQNPRQKVNKLSGGQQQAVAIGKAVSFNPKVVIMDEPTANLAQKEIDKVLELTMRLKDHGIAVIFISHRLDDVLRVTDRIFVLRGGARVAVVDTEETNKDEILKLMFIGREEENRPGDYSDVLRRMEGHPDAGQPG